jgi:hypothetical protein
MLLVNVPKEAANLEDALGDRSKNTIFSWGAGQISHRSLQPSADNPQD